MEAPLYVAFALRLAQSVSSVWQSTQRDQSSNGICGQWHFCFLFLGALSSARLGQPTFFREHVLWEHRFSLQHFSPPDGNATARGLASSRREANTASVDASRFHVETHLVASHFQIISISQMTDEPGKVFLLNSFLPALSLFSLSFSLLIFFYITSSLQLECSFIFSIVKQAFILYFAL